MIGCIGLDHDGIGWAGCMVWVWLALLVGLAGRLVGQIRRGRAVFISLVAWRYTFFVGCDE